MSRVLELLSKWLMLSVEVQEAMTALPDNVRVQLLMRLACVVLEAIEEAAREEAERRHQFALWQIRTLELCLLLVRPMVPIESIV